MSWRRCWSGELLAGKPADVGALASELLGVLGRGGRSVQREGKPVTDAAETLVIVTEAVQSLIEKRLPILRRNGWYRRRHHDRLTADPRPPSRCDNAAPIGCLATSRNSL